MLLYPLNRVWEIRCMTSFLAFFGYRLLRKQWSYKVQNSYIVHRKDSFLFVTWELMCNVYCYNVILSCCWQNNRTDDYLVDYWLSSWFCIAWDYRYIHWMYQMLIDIIVMWSIVNNWLCVWFILVTSCIVAGCLLLQQSDIYSWLLDVITEQKQYTLFCHLVVLYFVTLSRGSTCDVIFCFVTYVSDVTVLFCFVT
jgi:hypothetical protein